MNLADVTVGISSFLRPGYLSRCLESIAEHLPEVTVLVADDSDSDICAKIAGPGCIRMAFDSGLSAKRNALVARCTSDLFCLFCDDFKADEECRAGVLLLLEVLDKWPDIAIAAGRVDGRAYEAMLEYIPGQHIRETRVDVRQGLYGRPAWVPVDLAVNYFLARTAVMRDVPWPENIRPVGGEHVAFWLDAKMKGYKSVFVHGVNVKTMTLGPEAQDVRYPAMRARAYATGHIAMKRHYNILKFIGMAGDES